MSALPGPRGRNTPPVNPWPLTITPTAPAGTPDVTGLKRTAILHTDGTLYLERFHLIDSDACTIRLHHWHASDEQRAPHDHPWSNCTTVLAGHLTEHNTAGATQLTPGTTVTRPAGEPHWIQLNTLDVWTLFVTGPVVRRWGFHTATGWVYWKDWPGAGRYEP